MALSSPFSRICLTNVAWGDEHITVHYTTNYVTNNETNLPHFKHTIVGKRNNHVSFLSLQAAFWAKKFLNKAFKSRLDLYMLG